MKNVLLPLVFFTVFTSCAQIEKNKDIKRDIISLSGEWQFCIDSLGEGFDNKAAQTVQVPHTWNVMEGLEEYHGKAWYKKTFVPNNDLKGKLNRIKFNAVYHTAIVYFNDKEMTKHIGSGYTPFYIDVTNELKYQEENVILVEVDNSFSSQAIPWGRSYDWNADGGIIRNVELISTGKPAIEFARISPSFNKEEKTGKVHIDIDMLAFENISGEIEIRVEVYKDEQEVKVIEFNKAPEKNISVEFDMENIELWHFDHPNVYDVEIEIEKDGFETDTYNTSFGFRKLETNGYELLLNGESIRVMAVEWMPGSSTKNGMAETTEELIENLKRIKEVNCVLTRFHWQQDEVLFDWCDRNGIMVQEEISVWGNMMPPWNDTIYNISESQLTEMINEHFNHPSIVMWGVGNEYSKEGTAELVSKFYTYCKKLDPERLVSFVSNTLHKDLEKDPTNRADVLMWNDYTETWYGLPYKKTPELLDNIHKAIPGKPLMISEYGLCEPAFKGGDKRRVEHLRIHNKYYDSRPWIVGAIYFSLNDYRTHMGEEGEGVFKQRVHGVYDIYEQPKPSKEVLKEISSPFDIVSTEVKEGKLIVKLLCRNIMPSYSCNGYYITISKEERGRAIEKITIPSLKPGEKTEVFFKETTTNNFVNIYRPNESHVISQEVNL